LIFASDIEARSGLVVCDVDGDGIEQLMVEVSAERGAAASLKAAQRPKALLAFAVSL
jgi:hypothetical protein